MQQDYHHRFSSTKRSFTAEITGLYTKGNRFGSWRVRQSRGGVNVQDDRALVKTYLLSLMSLHLVHQDFPPPLLSLSSSGLVFLQPLSDLTDIVIIRGGLYQLNGI